MAPHIDFLDRRKPLWRRTVDKALRGGGPLPHLARIQGRREEMQRVLEEVDLVLTPSGYTRDTFQGWGVRREILVEHLGVDLASAQAYRETSAPLLRFGFLGKMIPTKGLEVLIDAFQLLDVEAELWIHGFGDGEYDSELRKRGVHPRIHFTGAFEQSQVPQIYSTFDVQVVPSTWLECSPLVVQTARLFRKPLIVSSIGGLIELVRDGVDGLRFPVGDAQALAAAMKRLVLDRDLVRRMKAALPPAGSVEDHAAAMARHYERLAARA
jgi:glycosyltransferase involved in cell wall biosynthesis